MIETSARFLYGLIHARYIVTSRGLSKMVSDLSDSPPHVSPFFALPPTLDVWSPAFALDHELMVG